jgi:hypothetical protein
MNVKVKTILTMERLSYNRDVTLVDAAEVGGVLCVVYDIEPIQIEDMARRLHQRRWTLVMPDGSRSSGIVYDEWKGT